MRKNAIIFLIVALMLLPSIMIAQPTPVTVYGYVWDADGVLLPNGVTVVVKNVDTGDYSNVTTSGGTYLSYISASLGDTIYASCSYLGESESNTTTVTDSLLQWLNITLEKGPAPKQPPIADFSWSPYNPVEGETVNFNDQSRDPDGVIVSWSWSLGDGTTSTSRYPSNSYMAGTYIVTLVVTDNDGLTGNKKDWVVVREKTEEEEERDIVIPPLPPPIYPPPPAYTIEEFYRAVNANDLYSSNKIKIAVIDTGVTLRTYDNTDMTDIIVYKHPSYATGVDQYGHGTMINYEVHFAVENYAPNCIQYSIRALDENGRAPVSVILDCFDIAMDLDVDIISLSAGARGQVGDILDLRAKRLRRNGILLVSAAGNDGYGGLISPALSEYAIGVGATDIMHTPDMVADDTICSWSSRGPVEGVTELKPDMVAPGESLIGPYGDGEKILSGTSISTPVVSGGIMVAMAKNKGLLDIVDIIYFFNPSVRCSLVEEAVEDTCFEKDDKFAFGNGIPNFKEASSRLHFLCILYILIPLVILISIIIVVIVVYWHYKKK